MRLWTAFFFVVILCAFQSRIHADLEVNVRQDKLVLTDGTEIPCLILAITDRAVLIVEADPNDPESRKQRAVPRRVIQRIVRGENEGVTEGLMTEEAQGKKVIAGVGFREEETPKSREPKTKDDKDGKGGTEKVAAKASKKEPKAPKPDGPVGPGKAGIVFAGKATKLTTEGVAGTIKGAPKEMADAYLQRFPALREASQSFLGADRLPQAFEQIQKGDGQARTQAESFLRVFMGNDTSSLGQMMAQGGTAGVSRPPRGPRRGAREQPAD